MRRVIAFLCVLVLSVSLRAENISALCISPGCIITTLQRAQFILNPATCEWEYIPGKANKGPAFIRGREQEFIVIKSEVRDGEEFVIAYQYTIFDLKDSVQTFCFSRAYLENQKAFSISNKTPA